MLLVIRKSPRRRYGLVVASIAVALCLKYLLQFLLHVPVSYLILFPALAFSAWAAGGRGGLLATALAGLISIYYVFVAPAPITAQHVFSTQIGLFIVFLLIGLLVSALGEIQERNTEALERELQSRQRAEQMRTEMIEQQRIFLHNILHVTTDGKLQLCFAAGELPEPIGPQSGCIRLTEPGQLRSVRRQAKEMALLHGFTTDRCDDLLTAAGEAAMNAIVHAGGGEAWLSSNGKTIQVRVADSGKGIDVAHLPRATMERGYTTAGSLGYGFKMLLATADRIWLMTGSAGTTVVIEQDRETSDVTMDRLLSLG